MQHTQQCCYLSCNPVGKAANETVCFSSFGDVNLRTACLNSAVTVSNFKAQTLILQLSHQYFIQM